MLNYNWTPIFVCFRDFKVTLLTCFFSAVPLLYDLLRAAVLGLPSRLFFFACNINSSKQCWNGGTFRADIEKPRAPRRGRSKFPPMSMHRAPPQAPHSFFLRPFAFLVTFHGVYRRADSLFRLLRSAVEYFYRPRFIVSRYPPFSGVGAPSFLHFRNALASLPLSFPLIRPVFVCSLSAIVLAFRRLRPLALLANKSSSAKRRRRSGLWKRERKSASESHRWKRSPCTRCNHNISR